jgi:hypothetical protein
MVRSQFSRTALGASLLLAGLAVSPGCGPDAGSTGGRVDSRETTEFDRQSNKANLPSLLEFGDKAAEQLAADLADIDEIEKRQTRAILELGTIVNKTRTPTQDFEQLQTRMRNAIRKSKFVRDRFKIVESRSRTDAEIARTQGPGPEDLLQEGGGGGGSNVYAPSDTYVLQGDFYEAVRGHKSQFYLDVKLVNLQSREIVFNHDYDLGQVQEK